MKKEVKKRMSIDLTKGVYKKIQLKAVNAGAKPKLLVEEQLEKLYK